ncbi:glucan 1,4-alpha-maltotetraohydrolase domain-containing protein [Pseudomonas sp. Irchel 3E20]|uniref:glucan 1,4-alpha-maltotetraohydrolase domain-containing protein n=1 Tax=Pseudomonas sp. Irchel 3E20 TaxID=2008983 RepID=UPI000BA4D091|nr:glucan 1,4-alpha-maltotetraohydrolase domain-containing protein [Pseudomonas sp. Irchel 3E20]
MKRSLLYYAAAAAACLLASLANAAAPTVRNGGGEDIILQGFHWNSSRNSPQKWYEVLTRMAPAIGQDGFSKIWLPPPWTDQSSWSDPAKGTSGGGEGYFWHDFDKNSQYGTDAQLKQAVAALTSAGVQAVYDVVPNHKNDKLPATLVRWPRGYKLWRDDCTAPAQCDEGDPFMNGLADLNTASPEVSPRFMQEFRNLRDNYAAKGLRFDFVRGYTPERVDLWMKDFNDQAFCVGELWKSPGEYPATDWRNQASWQDALKDWADRSHCAVFDFALKERLQNGGVADWRHGLNGNPEAAWRQTAVTFVDNHDTGYSPGQYGGQHHWALPDPLRNLAYTYILLSPGTPTVYWPDMYDWGRGDLIRKLIKLRKDAGIKADSPIRFQAQYSGLVAATEGSRQQVLLALDSDLSKVPEGFTPVLDADGQRIRVWLAAPATPGAATTLHCDNVRPGPGQAVFAVGAPLALGAWDPAHAIALQPGTQNRWSGTVSLATQQSIEWKCLIRSLSNVNEVYWQGDPNNRVVPGATAESVGSF